MALLSFVLCSRNDRHAGNAVWRLETTLNYVGLQVESLGREADVELIVTDWGSVNPLRDVLSLSPAAAKITRFLEVDAELAANAQGDSPFAEVLANNAAIRRATGEFVGRIDQDTLVGARFLEGFLSAVQGDGDVRARWSDAMLFVGRRTIPESFARVAPPFADVVRYVERFGRFLPREGRLQSPWFDAPVGAVILSRRLWETYRGYDERLLYWGFMETDLGLRVAMERRVIDLERELGIDFYHLGHSRSWFTSTTRRKNRRRTPSAEIPNDENWGLRSLEIPSLSATAGAKPELAGDEAVPARLGQILAEWGRQGLLAAARFGRRIVLGDLVEPAS